MLLNPCSILNLRFLHGSAAFDTADHFSLLKGLLTWPQDSLDFPCPILATLSWFRSLVPPHLPDLLTWSAWSKQLGPLPLSVWPPSAGNVTHLTTLHGILNAQPLLLTPSVVKSLVDIRIWTSNKYFEPIISKTEHTWSVPDKLHSFPSQLMVTPFF